MTHVRTWAVFFVVVMSFFEVRVIAQAIEDLKVPRMNFMSTECHPNRKSKTYVHDPVARHECYACHKPLASDHQFENLELASRTYTECHDKFVQPKAVFPDRKTHACATCHDPHESDHSKFLKTDQSSSSSQFCFSCHQETLQKKEVGHHPVSANLKQLALKQIRPTPSDSADCLACHDIHRSASPYLFKQANNQLCGQCHEAKLLKQRNHLVVKDGHQHEQGCLNCHQLHAGMLGSALLKANLEKPNICVECHERQATVLNSKHDMQTWAPELKAKVLNLRQIKGAQMACQICHAMHNSDVAKNHLRELTSVFSLDPISNQCLSCHDNDAFENKIIQVRYYSHPNKILSVSLAKQKYRPDDFSVRFFSLLGDEIKDNRQAVTLSCGSCHNPHVWSSERVSQAQKTEPGTIRNSFLINNNKTMMLCSSCHGEDAIVYYSKFHTNKVRKLDFRAGG